MGYDEHAPGEQAQGDKPLLSIVEAVILEGDTRPAKHRSASLKSRPCLAKLLPFFASSRSYLTLYGSSFCSYMHEKASSHGQTGSELPIRSVRAESQVRSMGRPARGVRGMDLDAGDYLVGMEIVEEEGLILSISENGFGKRTKLADYRLQSRGGKGVINMKTSTRNGKIVGILSVKEDTDLMIVTKNGKIIRLESAEIRQAGRSTQGVRLVRMEDDDQVAAASVIPEAAENGDGKNGNDGQPDLPLQ
jgi:hypothetical protein